MPNALQYDLLTIVQSSIQARGLLDANAVLLPNGAVVLQKVASNSPKDIPAQPSYPVILVAPFGAEGLDPNAGTNIRDDVVYKILIAILANDPPETRQTANFNLYLYWRESLRKLFHNQPLPNQVTTTVNGVSYASGQLAYEVQVQPLDVVDREAWFKKVLFASGLVLNCTSREGRG